MNDNSICKTTITTNMIIDYLVRYSSETHKVCINEMASYFVSKIDYLTWFIEENCLDVTSIDEVYLTDEQEEQINRHCNMQKLKTEYDQTVYVQVKRLLKKILNKYFFLGIRIRSSVSKDGYDVMPKNISDKVFYAETPLNESSINLLRDSLEVFTYAEPAKTKEIISRLNMLTPYYNRREYDPTRVNAVKYKGTYYENVEELSKAFKTIKNDGSGLNRLSGKDKTLTREDYLRENQKKVNKVSFIYCTYNEKKELVPKMTRSGKTVRTVNPVKLMWSNGYYYLVTVIKNGNAQSENDKYIFVNYRVDRMKNVCCLDEEADIYMEIQADKYREKHPVMYGGVNPPSTLIEIRCKKSIINNAIDTFGFGIRISETEKADEVIISLHTDSYPGVKMWALEYGNSCEIISPKQLRDEITADVRHMRDIYLAEENK